MPLTWAQILSKGQSGECYEALLLNESATTNRREILPWHFQPNYDSAFISKCWPVERNNGSVFPWAEFTNGPIKLMIRLQFIITFISLSNIYYYISQLPNFYKQQFVSIFFIELQQLLIKLCVNQQTALS